MGTSRSKPSAKGGSPLVPSWADQDPLPKDGSPSPPSKKQDVLEPRRNTGFRRSLRRYFGTGDKRYAHRALGHFSRGSMGGGAAASEKLARAARIGGSAFSALSHASAGQPPVGGGLDLRTLAGQSVSQAIVAIVDAFCPSGILDEDAIRVAMSEALAEALSGLDQFNPANIDSYTVLVAIRCFVAELVFNAVVSEQGQVASDVTPQQAIERENQLRAIIHEITDIQATPILKSVGTMTMPAQISDLVKEISTAVYEELAGW